MRRAARLAAAVTILLAAAPAAAYVRSSDDGCGACFYWPSRDVPYVVNPPGDANDGVLEPSCGASPAADAVRLGFEAWSFATREGESTSCTDLKLPQAAATSTSTFVGYKQGTLENLVVFRRGICDDLVPQSDPCWTVDRKRNPDAYCDTVHNCFPLDSTTSRSTIALTTVTYSPSTGRILDADMELVAWDGLVPGAQLQPTGAPSDGWLFSCADPHGTAAPSACTSYGDTGCYFMDLRNTVTHEAGHFIGLAHPCEAPSCGTPEVQQTTMYPSAMIGETKKRDLAPDDLAAVCDVYPASAATPTCPSSCAEESSGCGCSTATPSGILGALLGLGALAPRLARRRRRRQDTTTDA
jgi:uncharacterized protein (TIGR03382 family)